MGSISIEKQACHGQGQLAHQRQSVRVIVKLAAVVIVKLGVIDWVRNRFRDTPWLSPATPLGAGAYGAGPLGGNL